MTNLIIFLMGLAIMLVLMMKTKLGPFNCMLIASVGIGIACNLGASTAISTTVDGFAGTRNDHAEDLRQGQFYFCAGRYRLSGRDPRFL